MKKVKILCVAALALGLMTGCSTSFNPDGTAIRAEKDGKLTAVVMETLDQSYYDSTELQELISTEVAEYNASAGSERIKVESFKAENQTANLKMTYQNGDDYAAFNNVSCYSGDILGAYDAGYDFETTFQEVQKGAVVNSAVTRSMVLNSYNYYTLILSETMDVEVDGTIVYVSSNVEVTGKNTCRVTAAAGTAAAAETEAETLEDGTVLLGGTEESEKSAGTAELAYIMYQ